MLSYDRKSYKVWVNKDFYFHIRSMEDLLRGNNIKMYSYNIFKYEPQLNNLSTHMTVKWK